MKLKGFTVGIVHTSFALVEMLNTLIKKEMEDAQIVNIVDDTTLSYVRENGVDAILTRRMWTYFLAAEQAGANVILNACSSVGETVDVARRLTSIPILKIDEPMAEKAVALGQRISVLATVPTTIGPTCRLLELKAQEAGVDLQLEPQVCEGAFDLLLAGRVEEHDRMVTKTVMDAAKNSQVIVFAQASMSKLAERLAPTIDIPLLSSPRFAVERLAEYRQKIQ